MKITRCLGVLANLVCAAGVQAAQVDESLGWTATESSLAGKLSAALFSYSKQNPKDSFVIIDGEDTVRLQEKENNITCKKRTEEARAEYRCDFSLNPETLDWTRDSNSFQGRLFEMLGRPAHLSTTMGEFDFSMIAAVSETEKKKIDSAACARVKSGKALQCWFKLKGKFVPAEGLRLGTFKP